jgi:hypothetical protein
MMKRIISRTGLLSNNQALSNSFDHAQDNIPHNLDLRRLSRSLVAEVNAALEERSSVVGVIPSQSNSWPDPTTFVSS